jgi:hypothetical protein
MGILIAQSFISYRDIICVWIEVVGFTMPETLNQTRMQIAIPFDR